MRLSNTWSTVGTCLCVVNKNLTYPVQVIYWCPSLTLPTMPDLRAILPSHNDKHTNTHTHKHNISILLQTRKKSKLNTKSKISSLHPVSMTICYATYPAFSNESTIMFTQSTNHWSICIHGWIDTKKVIFSIFCEMSKN